MCQMLDFRPNKILNPRVKLVKAVYSIEFVRKQLHSAFSKSEVNSSYKVFVFCCFQSDTTQNKTGDRSIAYSHLLMMTLSSFCSHSKYATFPIQNV